jgi:hypothetical protein
MKVQSSRCLVLNGDYSPICVVSWTKAISWHVKYSDNLEYGVDILDFYKDDYILGTNNKKFPIPAVVKTKQFFKINKCNVNFSRKNIFIRDNYTCQYCGYVFDHNQLTYDHVVPKSMWDHNNGSPTTWTNITTACIDCNRKKGNRTPSQARMPLLQLPYAPSKNIKYLPISRYLSKIREDIPEEWLIYLPKSYIQI